MPGIYMVEMCARQFSKGVFAKTVFNLPQTIGNGSDFAVGVVNSVLGHDTVFTGQNARLLDFDLF